MKEKIWATLVHLGTNMWYEEGNNRAECDRLWNRPASPTLRFDKSLWPTYLQDMKNAGCNTIILDLAEGIKYSSHPELAIDGSLSREEIEAEINRIHSLGMKIIPKLNFSACHDYWLGEYAKMLSTQAYYKACTEIIDEVIDLFKPEYLHIGFDEEVYENQKRYDYVAIRQNELWWHDLYFFVDYIESKNVRVMIWSDYARERAEEFIQKCPKSVVQCVWYYFDKFEEPLSYQNEIRVRPFKQLAEAGYDIVAGGSVEYFYTNLPLLADYCKKNLASERLLGFCQTTWASVEHEWDKWLDDGNKALAEAKTIFEEK